MRRATQRFAPPPALRAFAHTLHLGANPQRGWLCAGALLLLLASSSAGGAAPDQTPLRRAMVHWRSGTQLFARAHYLQAMAEFAQGYALSHKPGFLFNMAECARLLGEKRQAHHLYRRYIVEHPGGKLRPEALQRCRELAVGSCLPDRKAPAAVATTAVAVPVAVAAVHASAPHPAVTPPPTPAPRPAARPFYKRWPLWVGIGAVVVAGSVTAAVLATRSRGSAIPSGEQLLDFSRP